MKITFTALFFFLLVCLLSSCSKKQTFFFSQDTGSFGSYQKLSKAAEVANEDFSTPEGATIDSIMLTASAQTGIFEAASPPARNRFMPAPPTVEYYKQKEKTPLMVWQIPAPVHKLLLKKSLKTFDEIGKKPTHKLAKISLGLGVASLALLLLSAVLPSITAVVGTLMLLTAIGAIITGRIAIKDINKNPDTYAGKGKALAGFVIGLVVSALFVLFVILAFIFLAMFLGSFS